MQQFAVAGSIKAMSQQASAGRRCLRAFLSGFFVAVPISVTALDRLAYVARVEGASMQVRDGGADCDVVLLNRWTVRNHEVQRGDVVSVM
ncbi:Mitochondrial inner membrane protease subunit 2 [Liparis tanakae]|uniref:Mitochondrial inner membrane protease subunit 2 n=1 Tax=Liparis tanakae TaxID=230148 RepID=A0A4Z2GV19_9TELE|nr:Mitochondrial inner membrane protease subunit 2 [Liparis tanakae]